MRRAPGWAVAAVALLLYPGVGLLLPLLLHWSVVGLVDANVIGTLFAAVVTLGWLIVKVEEGHRRHLIDWTTNLRLLSSEEFEWLVGELFRREGWQVEETGRQDSPDGNIDLVLMRDGVRRIVQCKRWQSWKVGVDEIREFGGTLLREQLPPSAGVFVTLSGFNQQARDEAEKMGINAIDGIELLLRVEKARRTEPCPECATPMKLDRSLHGWWLRCVTPGCHGKRDLGNDAGRAIEFLIPAA